MADQTQRQVPLQNQESVWDYPRPPRIESINKHIQIIFNGVTIANTTSAFRVLETSHPPVYYIPQSDIQMDYLRPAAGNTFCEFKGAASYWTLEVKGKVAERVAWSYANPLPGFQQIGNCLAFYAGPMDGCYINGEQVTSQPGNFYGGWITSDIVGPFKGGPGTSRW